MSGFEGRRPERADTDVVGERVLAQLIDTVIGVGLVLGTAVGLSIVLEAVVDAIGSETLALWLGILTLAIAFSAFVLYFVLLEGLWDGYTVGKRIAGIKVVGEDGSSCSLRASIVRNVLRPIDGFLYYAVGYLAMATSDRRQRIGDRIAGTVVVSEP